MIESSESDSLSEKNHKDSDSAKDSSFDAKSSHASTDDYMGNMGDGWSAFSTLISGMIVWGGVGWLADRWLETNFCVAIGLVFGMICSVYLIFRKYG